MECYGEFYATEFSQQPFEKGGPFTGAVVRVPAHSTSPIVVADGLSFPNGFAATEDAIYVSNWSIYIASPPQGGPPPGEVVKIGLPAKADIDTSKQISGGPADGGSRPPAGREDLRLASLEFQPNG